MALGASGVKGGMTDLSRLDALEIRISHQEHVIEELNATVTSQWKEIDRLKRDVAMLTDRLANAELSLGPDPGDEPPPPHW